MGKLELLLDCQDLVMRLGVHNWCKKLSHYLPFQQILIGNLNIITRKKLTNKTVKIDSLIIIIIVNCCEEHVPSN